MSYFNYHSSVKRKIENSGEVQMIIVNNYKDISPCLVVITDSGNYPIREYRWQEYFDLADRLKIIIKDKRNDNKAN